MISKEKLVSQNEKQTKIYKKLHLLGKTFNETATVKSLHKIAVDFVIEELGFEKAVFFEHREENGWFHVVESRGYNDPKETKILKIISLLLSGEIIEVLRINKEPIIHTSLSYKEDVAKFLKAIFLEEAYIELIGGDIEIPHGVLIAGNSKRSTEFTNLDVDQMLLLALGNFTVQLSNAINNVIFYNQWKQEKFLLEENIKNRTKIIESQKEKFEAIYKTSKDGIALLDLETTAFIDVNPAYAEITGYTQEELLRTSCIKLSFEEDREKTQKALDEVLKIGYLKDFQKRCVAKDGKIIMTNMSIVLMPDTKNILVSIKDITELKKQEQVINEQAKLASMGEMIGNIAHQWRQPLSLISTCASGMALQKEIDQLSDEQLYEYCEMIDKNAQYLSQTIDDFRNFIKGDTKAIRFKLKKNVESFIKLVNTTIKKDNIQLEVNIDENLELSGYPNELNQCIINLFNNSRDAFVYNDISESSRYISIDAKVENNKIYLVFHDNAQGIPQNIINKIFEPYFTTKHQYQGTGLGLHMTYNLIVNHMQGKISVENKNIIYNNQEFLGAKFIIILPF